MVLKCVYANPENSSISVYESESHVRVVDKAADEFADIQSNNLILPYVDPLNKSVNTLEEVTMRQARLALLNAGLLAEVAEFMNAIADPVQREAAKIEWEYAQTVRRDNPLINSFAQSHPMTDAEVDALFIAASEI